jgi:aminoglycoside phosphotransferase (APT) family kinase protein
MSENSKEALLRWVNKVTGARLSDLQFEPLLTGRSNLSYRILVQGEPVWVLRRPPEGPILESAHDLRRECRVLRALENTTVPVPKVIAFHEPEIGLEIECYIMSYVAGSSLPDATALNDEWLERRAEVLDSMIQTLVQIHEVNLVSTGLSSYGQGTGYIERQLRRWLLQWQDTPGKSAFRIPLIHNRLEMSRPRSGSVTLVHGDFGVANVILGDTGHVAGVLDWELSTTGDPLADVGTLLVYLDRDLWCEEQSSGERAEVIRHYSTSTGQDLSLIEFYVALGNWKLACIGEGVRNRYESKAINDPDVNVLDLGRAVESYLDAAEAALERMGSVQ